MSKRDSSAAATGLKSHIITLEKTVPKSIFQWFCKYPINRKGNIIGVSKQ